MAKNNGPTMTGSKVVVGLAPEAGSPAPPPLGVNQILMYATQTLFEVKSTASPRTRGGPAADPTGLAASGPVKPALLNTLPAGAQPNE
jgi:hypothetical protein